MPSTSKASTRSEGCTQSAAGEDDEDDEEDEDEKDEAAEAAAAAAAAVAAAAAAGGTKAMKRHVPSEEAEALTPNSLVPKPPHSQP